MERGMTKKEIIAGISAVLATIVIVVTGLALYKVPAGNKAGALEYWTESSKTARSVIDFVSAATDKSSGSYVPPEKRIAVFDVDGTLMGELYPTYFDTCLLIHRLLHDESYTPPDDVREYAAELENALYNYLPEPESDFSAGQLLAEAFRGYTPEEFARYVREFMSGPACGFDGMTYGEGFYKPMVTLVKYLSENGFTVFLCSGSERTLVREIAKDTLGEWVPPCNMIGTTFSLAAENQGDKNGRKYDYTKDDRVLYTGDMLLKNQKMNKVINIVNEIGAVPVLVFGNSGGDISMAQYCVQNGGKAYMLLCDDTERDYGRPDVAEEFRVQCEGLGFETVSMKNEFATIYGYDVKKTALTEPLAPAA